MAKPYSHQAWHAPELDALRRYFETRPKAFIEGKIPNHSWEGIRIKAGELGIRRSKKWQLQPPPDDCLHVIGTAELLYALGGFEEKHAERPYPKFTDKQLQTLEHYARTYGRGRKAPDGSIRNLAERWGRTRNCLTATISTMRRKMCEAAE